MDREEDPLEKLNARLYANKPIEVLREEQLALHPVAPAQGWERTPPPTPKKPMPYATIFLFGALGFFVLSAATGAFFYYNGISAITSDKIEISVTSPTPTIASGDTVPLVITIRNDNPTLITRTNLIVTFPEGTQDASTTDMAKLSYSDTLGDIAPGAEVTRTVPAIFFGGQNQVISIPVHFQYQVAGSNAVFTANYTYMLSISTSPVSVQVNTLSETASGQPFSVQVSVHSNASIPLQNIAVAATYPASGYVLQEATPTAAVGSFFTLGSLAPGETKTVRLNGVLTGQKGEQRTFNFAVGTAREDGTAVLSAPYTSTQATVAIMQPFIGTTLSLNRETAETVVAAAGGRVDASLMWQNNLTVPISDVRATIALTGTAFDPASVSVTGGFYNSANRTILFSRENTPGLAQLQAGDTAVGTFSFVAKTASQLKNTPNPTITATVSVAGMRPGQGSVPQSISSSVVRTIRIGTDVALTSTLLHTDGPFPNTGPVPPVPGTETTYTVVLGASNTVNRVGAGKLVLPLPSYVRYTGVSSAADALTYDETARTLTWTVGEFGPEAAKSIAFQVALLPSTTQRNSSPVIISPGSFTGVDTFSTTPITSLLPATTLQDQSDRGFNAASGTIQ